MEEQNTPTTSEDEDVEAHQLDRPPHEDRDTVSEDPDVEGHLLPPHERPPHE